MYDVCRQRTRLFAVLPLENRHEIALYRSASQFIFFERCLESRTSLLSSSGDSTGGPGGQGPPTIASAPPRLLLIKVVH